MTRSDLCASDDFDAIERLAKALGELGIMADDAWHDSPIATGLQSFRKGDQTLTVFRDAWFVDIAGPDELVNEVLAAMRD